MSAAQDIVTNSRNIGTTTHFELDKIVGIISGAFQVVYANMTYYAPLNRYESSLTFNNPVGYEVMPVGIYQGFGEAYGTSAYFGDNYQSFPVVMTPAATNSAVTLYYSAQVSPSTDLERIRYRILLVSVG